MGRLDRNWMANMNRPSTGLSIQGAIGVEDRGSAPAPTEAALSEVSPGARAVLLLTHDLELSGLAEIFIKRGFRLECQRELRGGLALVLDGGPSLVILDGALLNGNVLEVLRWIRRRTWVPLILLADHVDRVLRIASLEAGADDYWVKPLDPDEVLARIHALLRRSGLAPLMPAGRLVISGITVEPALRRVSVDGQRVGLTSLEYDLLEYLIHAAGRIVSRDELMAVIIQREASPLDRALDVHVSRLRKKLGGRRMLIRTERGAGYVFCPEIEGVQSSPLGQ
jgi:two-component system, OmpR family, response regulator CpxR